MYRRGFSVSGLRNSARSYYYRVQRMRNRRSIFAGIGCLVVGVIVVCCLLTILVAVYLVAPLRASGAQSQLPAALPIALYAARALF